MDTGQVLVSHIFYSVIVIIIIIIIQNNIIFTFHLASELLQRRKRRKCRSISMLMCGRNFSVQFRSDYRWLMVAQMVVVFIYCVVFNFIAKIIILQQIIITFARTWRGDFSIPFDFDVRSKWANTLDEWSNNRLLFGSVHWVMSIV